MNESDKGWSQYNKKQRKKKMSARSWCFFSGLVILLIVAIVSPILWVYSQDTAFTFTLGLGLAAGFALLMIAGYLHVMREEHRQDAIVRGAALSQLADANKQFGYGEPMRSKGEPYGTGKLLPSRQYFEE